MAKKRKRADIVSTRPSKKHKLAKHEAARPQGPAPEIHHEVLSSFYPRVCTLRNYLVAGLPATSRHRRRTLTAFQKGDEASILDTCLVGVLKQPSLSITEARKAEFVAFTQTQHRPTGLNTGRSQPCSIDEVVDFVIWVLFHGELTKGGRPCHILCHGLQRGTVQGDGNNGAALTSLPGIVQRHPNDNLTALKCPPWSDLLSLLGADAEVIFASLLLDCGIFTRVQGGKENYFQFSGVPLSDLSQIQPAHLEKSSKSQQVQVQIQKVGNICFVRNRMLYARASLSAAGKIRYGLHHTHIFQRVPDAKLQGQEVHLLKYVFPRQFGLHNVFTSKVDRDETVQKLKDYTFREQEITAQNKKASSWAPRRLRSGAKQLVERMHRNHQNCSYNQLLRHHCPIVQADPDAFVGPGDKSTFMIAKSETFVTQISLSRKPSAKSSKAPVKYDGDASFLFHATPTANVSAFCRAAISQLLPGDAFGSGSKGQRNLDQIMRRIDEFVHMRRFESLTLHQTVQGLRTTCIRWLSRPGDSNQKISKSDHSKRLEILCEFVYYIFDSLLIPIVRAHFYVTESSTHRYRLFYFRHDVWRKLSTPSFATLQLNLYAPLKPADARRQLLSRSLGYSQLRLLPKDQGARSITNLKRRQLKLASGKRVLGPSINSQLAPLFSILNFERARDASPLGSGMLTLGEIHGKVAQFKSMVPLGSRLFFAKVDIKSCFDSIPQEALLDLVEPWLSETSYRTSKHMEAKHLDFGDRGNEAGLRRKFVSVARPADDRAVVSEASISATAAKKHHAIFSEAGQGRSWNRQTLLKLLHDHVSNSMVKVGKKYMKQADGIPQGSVLSSLLCSYFYGAFERCELGFLHPQSCLLLRFIDDFLLVTTNEDLARRFLEVMANGGRPFGIQVNPQKSLVNFEVVINGRKVPRTHGERAFPYCGVRIDVKTLALKKDRDKKDAFVKNSLTVDSCSKAGSVLKRKTLASLKLQMQSMLLDVGLNGRSQVVSTMIGNFTESAMKMHQYLAGLARQRRPTQEFLMGLIQDMVSAGWKLCRARNSNNGEIKHVTRAQMCWIASTAFARVLSRKQSLYRELLAWLQALSGSSEAAMNMERVELRRLLEDNDKAFRDYVY